MSQRVTLLNAPVSAGTKVTDALSLGRIPTAAEYLAVQTKFVSGPTASSGYTLNQDVATSPSAVRVTISDITPSITRGMVKVKGLQSPTGDLMCEDIDISAGAGVYETSMLFTEVSDVFSWNLATLGGGADESIRAEWMVSPYIGYAISQGLSANSVEDMVNVTIADDGASITTGTVRIDGISNGVVTFENIDISGGAGVYPSANTYTEITGVATVDVATIGGPVLALGGLLTYDNGTPPTAGKIVTIPDGHGTDYVYTFKVDAASTGNFSYTDITPPSADQTVTIPYVGGSRVYKFVAAVVNDWEVKIEATADDSFTNLADAINMTDAVGVGNNMAGGKYKVPSAHTLFSAVITTATDDIDLTAKLTGERGNVSISTTCTGVTKTNPTGGAGVTNAGDVKVGTADATMLNLTRAINNSGGSSGVNGDYLPARSQAHPLVVAVHNAAGDLVTFTVQTVGIIGNINITTDEATITPTDPSSGSEDETILVEWDADGADIVVISNIVNETGKDLVDPANLVEPSASYNMFVQTTLDDGTTWCDVMNFLFTTVNLTKIHAVKLNTALAANVTPTDGGMSGNAILSGLIGNKIRLKYTTTDEYVDASIVVDVAVR